MSTSGRTPTKQKFEARFNWKIMLFSTLMLPLLTGLGIWQLQRAEDKRTIQESWREQQALAPVPFAEISDHPRENYRRVSLHGKFDGDHYWLLENQILDGRLGYAVLMPFYETASSHILIVNRGWLPAEALRSDLPAVYTPQGAVTVTGSLTEPSDNYFINDTADYAESWPRKVLEVDLDLLTAQVMELGYHAPVYDRVLQIDPGSPAAFDAYWQPMNMTTAKHTGYAVQWFTMAAALLLLTIIANSNLTEILRNRKSGSS